MTRHVPISAFKDHASELVAAAERGEEIVITRHGKAAARLLAADQTDAARRAKVQAALDRLAELRAIQRARGITTTIDEIIAWKKEGQK